MSDSSMFVDIMLWAMYLLLAAATGMAAWSAIHGVHTHERAQDPLASRRTSMLGYATMALVALVLAITFAAASTQPIMSNGKPFADTLWLRLTDMFIFTSLILICICSAIVAIAKFRR